MLDVQLEPFPSQLDNKSVKFRKITLKDFQAHAERTIEFAPTITTIIGPTDRGKSAILRALRWVALNDFAGADFIREGAKEAVAEVTVREQKQDFVITRERGERRNTYALTPPGAETVMFRAFGTGVPEDLEKLLRLTEINFQGQHDGPFWFGQGGIELSRKLNAVIDLSIMDTSLSNANGFVIRGHSRVNSCEESLDIYTKQLEAIKAEEPRIEEFKDLEERYQAWQVAATRTRKIQEYRSKRLAVKGREAIYQDLQELLSYAKTWRTLSKQTTDLQGIVDGCVANQVSAPPDFKPVQTAYQQAVSSAARCLTLERLLSQIQTKAGQVQAPPSFKPVQEAFDTAVQAAGQTAKLERLLGSLRTSQQALEDRLQQKQEAVERFQQKTKNMNCPTCGQKLNEAHSHLLQ